MSRRHTVRQWYRLQATKRRLDREMPRSVSHAQHLGLIVQDWTLREGDGFTNLAEFLRHGERPLVRLVLPNPITVGTHRMIRDVVMREGGQVVIVPRRTMEAASIEPDTIEVIDTRKTKRLFRADEQLIKAKCWYKDYRQKWYSATAQRTAYFLSGFDANEPGLSYFFCELPPGAEPKTVAEAYAALMPESVKLAIKGKRKVERQGDMFFVRMPRSWRPSIDSRLTNMRLHDSNHFAAEGTVIDGVSYVTGTIKHNPSGRRPDHRPLRLGNRWWLCVRNTVPLSE